MDSIAAARVLHVLAVVVWIGGVATVTTAVLPAVRRGDLGADRLRAVTAVERRFVWQARTAIVVVGASGLYMVVEADLWNRFRYAEFWWMHAMVGVWSLFALGLFAVEPFFLDRKLRDWVTTRPDHAFKWVQRVHWVLLALSFVTICGAVAGNHG